MGLPFQLTATLLVFLLCQDLGATASKNKITKELSFPFFENEFNFPDDSFELYFKDFKGELKIANTMIRGMDTLHINAELEPKTGRTSSSILSSSEIGVFGSYELYLTGQTPSGFKVTVAGNGSHANWIRNISMGHQAVLSNSNGVLQVSDLDIWISFDSLSFSVNNLSVNEFNLDWIWKPLNRFLNGSFQELFSEVKGPLVELITKRLNAVFQEQKLSYSQVVAILKEV